MMEPRRLLEQGATDAERMLLKSACLDRPPQGAAQQMLVALQGLAGQGAASALPRVGSPAAASPLKAAATALWAKIGSVGLIGLVGLGTLGVGAMVYSITGQSPNPQTTVTRTPTAHEQLVPVTAENPRSSDHRGRPSIATPPETDSPALPSVSGNAPRKTNSSAGSLSAEIRMLDLARSAVEAHDLPAAQRALDSYRRRFPHGHLDPEATVLRLAVLVQQGKRTAAQSLAAQLLASESYKTYESRIRSLLRDVGTDRSGN
jgi:hypothetical protein